MATLSETDLTRLSTEAAGHFVDNYYTILNGARAQIPDFYVPPQKSPSTAATAAGAGAATAPTEAPAPSDENDRSLPQISFNGELMHDGAALRDRFVSAMPYTFFEPQAINVHVVNPCLVPPPVEDDAALAKSAKAHSKRDAERNVSIIVQVSGSVRLVERKEGPLRGFADSFVLVPNKEEVGGKGTGKMDHGRRWLIQSQSLRFVT